MSMSNIDYIIGESNFEKIRSKIASILADEFSNQKSLISTALLTETDQDVIDDYNISLNAIPNKVWEERFRRPSEGEYPVVNVFLQNNPLNDLIGNENQTGTNTFGIEFYMSAKDTDTDRGDKLSAIKLQRLIGITRHIIMTPHYLTLGFGAGFIGHRSAQNMIYAQPEDGVSNADNVIMGKLDIIVKSREDVEKLDGVLFDQNDTTFKLFDTEKGFFWTTNN